MPLTEWYKQKPPDEPGVFGMTFRWDCHKPDFLTFAGAWDHFSIRLHLLGGRTFVLQGGGAGDRDFIEDRLYVHRRLSDARDI